MSRIGKKPIAIPDTVTVTVDGSLITVKGPKGTLSRTIHPDIIATVEGKEIVFSEKRRTKQSAALWGLFRSLVANMVQGVVDGFEKKLEIEGVGYRASMEGKDLLMQLGFSHSVRFKAPEAITLGVERNVITIAGIDKEGVGQTAAMIRAQKKPEPYKGKGIHYRGEVIRRKAGKRAGAA